jgi:hypothetical protein
MTRGVKMRDLTKLDQAERDAIEARNLQGAADSCIRVLSWWAPSEMNDTCRACKAPVHMHKSEG